MINTNKEDLSVDLEYVNEHFQQLNLTTDEEKDFRICESLYEKNVDLNNLYLHSCGIKYLLTRSFSKSDLIQINESKDKKKNIENLRVETFISKKIDELILFVLSKKQPFSKEYVTQVSSELKTICIQSSSVHKDNFNSNINKIIRNKEICSYSILADETDNKLVTQLRNYVKWQWYNQKCSDLIENIIMEQSNIIQTLRKIKNIDFFVEIEKGFIFPFDLKLTVFPIGFMKTEKIPKEKVYIENFLQIKENHYKLLKWLYTEQNPRLFSNNYRFFVVLLNLGDAEASYKLKCNIELIGNEIKKFFSQINMNDIIDVEYRYKKDKSKEGDYHTKCIYSIIMT